MTVPWLPLLLALFLQAPFPQGGAREHAAPLESGMVRSLELEPLPGTHALYFRLDGASARPDQAPVGLLRYVAGPDREGGVRVDFELQYLATNVRVLHTEQASLACRHLVFRELREGAGRTLFLQGTPAAGFEGHELGIGEVVRRALPGPGEFPLLLLESARLGQELPPEALVLDPLSAGFESLRLTCTVQGDLRAIEARRLDGSLRWRVVARGEELLEWRFQERGPVARSVPREVFEALLEQHAGDQAEVREAAAAPDPASRR